MAFTCGLEKIVLPFIDKGLPAEYELVRSLSTVTRQKRKRIGVLETDAHVSGNFTQMGMSPSWQLIDELKKQYEVVQVSPADLAALGKPGEESKHYDVLLAIQPSAMGQQEMESFVAAIRAGQKAVIFEDPCFLMMSGIPGTYQPRQPQGGMFGGYSPEQQQKGDIGALWRLLGVDFSNGGGDSNEFNPMAGPQPSRSMGSIVWQPTTHIPSSPTCHRNWSSSIMPAGPRTPSETTIPKKPTRLVPSCNTCSSRRRASSRTRRKLSSG